LVASAGGLFGGFRGGDRGGERILMQPLDHGAEQRFLGLEMMVERLPRQPGRFRRLFDRRTPKPLAAKHQHGGVEDAVARLHLTILTKYDEMSNDGKVSVDVARRQIRFTVLSPTICRSIMPIRSERCASASLMAAIVCRKVATFDP